MPVFFAAAVDVGVIDGLFNLLAKFKHRPTWLETMQQSEDERVSYFSFSMVIRAIDLIINILEKKAPDHITAEWFVLPSSN